MNDHEVAVLAYALENYVEAFKEYRDIPSVDIQFTLEFLDSVFHEEYDKRGLHYTMFFDEVEDE
jgi:hypothetical protein